MPTTPDTFDDLPILAELRSNLEDAFRSAEDVQPARRLRQTPRLARPRPARRPVRKRLLGAAVTVAVLGGAAAALVGFQGGHLRPSSAVAATMNRFAGIAAGEDWGGVPGPGQYAYTVSEDLQAGYPVRQMQTWLSSSGQALISNPEGNKNDGQVEAIQGPGTYFPTTVSGWQALSDDPGTLLQQLKQLDAPGGPDTPAEQFVVVGDALRTTAIPQATRALLFQAVALIPGVQLMGAQTDPTGHAGTGVGYYQDGHLQTELIIDPQTSQLLGELDYDQNGNLTNAASIITQTVVDTAPSVGAMPPVVQYPAFTTTTAAQTSTN